MLENNEDRDSELEAEEDDTNHCLRWVLGIIILVGIASGSWYLAAKIIKSNSQNKSANPTIVTPAVQNSSTTTPKTTSTKSTTTSASTTQTDSQINKTTLQVSVVKSGDAQIDGLLNNTSIDVTLPDNVGKTDIQAYGFNGQIFLAPAGWTAQGTVGEDGGVAFYLFPTSGSTTSGARFMFNDSGGCTGCSIDNAAHYFPDVLNSSVDIIKSMIIDYKPITGLTLTPLSQNLAEYSLPNTSDGLAVEGVAYQNGIINNTDSDITFEKLEIYLPATQHNLSTFLLNDFISRNKLK